MLCGGKKRARSKEDQAQVKASIIDAARSAIAKDGPAHLSMRKVAKAAGCSAGTLYLYFADRDEMLREVWHDDFEQLESSLDDAIECEDNPICQARALLQGFARYWLARPDQFWVVYMGSAPTREKKPGPTPDLLAGMDTMNAGPVHRMHQRLLELVCEARMAGRFGGQCQCGAAEAGVTPEDRMIADTLIAGVHGVVAMHIGTPNYPWSNAEAMIDRIVKTMLFALTAKSLAA